MVHNGSAIPASGCGISLTELAAGRGISKDAARRLVKAGKVQGHQVPGIHGPAWCVHPDESPPLRNGDAGDAPGVHQGPATVAPDPDLGGLVALVDRLQMENRQLAEAAAVWQERARMLADQLALTAPPSPVLASTAPELPNLTMEPAAPWLRAPAPWLLAVLAIVGVVALLAVSR